MPPRGRKGNGNTTTTIVQPPKNTRRATRSSARSVQEQELPQEQTETQTEPQMKANSKKAPKRKRAPTTLETATDNHCHKTQTQVEQSRKSTGGGTDMPKDQTNPDAGKLARIIPTRPSLLSDSENENEEACAPGEESDDPAISDVENANPTAKQIELEVPMPMKASIPPFNQTPNANNTNLTASEESMSATDQTLAVEQTLTTKPISAMEQMSAMTERASAAETMETTEPMSTTTERTSTMETTAATEPTSATTAPTNSMGTRRAQRVLEEIPITSLPLAQPPPRFDTPPPITQPLPATWTSATDLVVKNNREPRQSLQCQDIKLCISNAVNRATANLFFVNGFPDLKTKNLWLGNSLAHELNNRSKTNLFLREVNARAQQDGTYFGQLFSMLEGRWSSARQNVTKVTREYTKSLFDGHETSQVIDCVGKLLHKEAYHFAKTPGEIVNRHAPYQSTEMYCCLSHFFNGTRSLGVKYQENLPHGKYGPEVPEAMVALTAVALKLSLKEWEKGKYTMIPFTESANREAYGDHLKVMAKIKASDKGDSKYARMMSTIYKQSLLAVGRTETTKTDAVNTEVTDVDIDGMAE